MFRVVLTAVLLAVGIGNAELLAQEPRVELRIGQPSGDPNYVLRQVRTGGVTRAGEIVVFDGGSGQVRVYSPQGRFFRAFGGKGAGPSQFAGAAYLTVSADEIVVREAQRTQFFHSNGKLLRTFVVKAGEPYVSPIARGLRGWVAAVRRAPAAAVRPSGQYYADSISVELIDSAGVPVRPLLKYAAQRIVAMPDVNPQSPTARPLFEASPRFGVDAGGQMYVTDREAYRIRVYDPSGKLIRTITRPHRPVKITQAHVDAYAKRVRDFYRSQPGLLAASPDELKRAIDYRLAAPRATVLPALGLLLVADDGSLWVERPDLMDDPAVNEFRRTFGTNRAPAAPATFDRFDPKGCFLGRTTVPAGFLPFHVTRSTILGMLPEDIGVETIVRLAAPGVCANR